MIPEKLLNFYIGVNDFDESHADHVRDVDTPGVAVMGFDDQQRAFTFLIDGTHRAVAQSDGASRISSLCAKSPGHIYYRHITTELSNTNFFWVHPSLRVASHRGESHEEAATR